MASLLAHNVANNDIERTSDVFTEQEQHQKATFSDLHLPKHVQSGLESLKFLHPSPVQLKAIPSARLGLDLLVQAKSGTGKTLVFVVTALSGIDPENVAGLQVIIN